jgi:hypothetical protein
MTLLQCFLQLLASWNTVFPQKRTHDKISQLLLRLLIAPGRRTLTAALDITRDWSSSYRAFSRSPWDPRQLFFPVWENTRTQLATLPFLPVAIDDTSTWKAGGLRQLAAWLRDALSPPFHVNLRRGLRWLHAALLLPLDSGGAMALSVAFQLACPPKKPKKTATAEERKIFRKLQRKEGLAGKAATFAEQTRTLLDQLGFGDKSLLLVTDGGYTNKTLLQRLPQRTHLVGRTRKDIAICRPAPPTSRKVYGDPLPTPDLLRLDESFPWLSTECFYGGQIRSLRYKDVTSVLWQRGAGRRLLRIIILAPTRYKPVGWKLSKRFHYNQPAFLLSTDLCTSAQKLLQAYLDRWQIEVLHRDLKSGLGIGQAQVWTEKAVKRIPAAIAAAFALLKLAAINAFGIERAAAFDPLPLWRRKKPRLPSLNDLISRLRADYEALPPSMNNPLVPLSPLSAPEMPPLDPIPLAEVA